MSMNTAVNRLHTNATTTLSMLASCAFLMASTSFLREYFIPGHAVGMVKPMVSQIQLHENKHPQKPSQRSKIDRAIIRLDVDVDFTAVFNWNIKQLFVYAIAEYSTEEWGRNEVTLWDEIITSKRDAKVERSGVVDYYFDHIETGLVGKDVNVRLYYHVMCYTGATFTRELESAQTTFQFHEDRKKSPRNVKAGITPIAIKNVNE